MNKLNKNNIIEQCILSLADGKMDAMDLLYATIKNDVYAFALSKVCNKFDSDDILQDTFIRIYENAKLYKPLGKPMAWIFTIETNVVNRYFIVKKRHETISEDILNNVSCEEVDKEYALVQNEYINKLLSSLNDFEREVISLHLVSDLKFKEIAKVLNKPLSTILSKYNRAIKKLKKLVKENNNEKETN